MYVKTKQSIKLGTFKYTCYLKTTNKLFRVSKSEEGIVNTNTNSLNKFKVTLLVFGHLSFPCYFILFRVQYKTATFKSNIKQRYIFFLNRYEKSYVKPCQKDLFNTDGIARGKSEISLCASLLLYT